MAERSDIRGRMDKSLDEIAAEMHSSSREFFGRDYEARELTVDSHRDHHSSHRYSPYSSDWRSERNRERDRDRDGDRDGIEGRVGSRIFVANLSYSVSWQKLKDHMKQVGPVVKCDIFKNADGSSRGMGLVVYADSESAQRALRELKDTEIEGRKLYLREDMRSEDRERAGMAAALSKPKPPSNPAASIFISNLEYSVTWQKIKDVFKVAGKVISVDLQRDKDGRSKGHAMVQFEKPIEAIHAITLFHGQMLHDRPMVVRMDSKAPFKPDPMLLKLAGPTGMGGSGLGLGGRGKFPSLSPPLGGLAAVSNPPAGSPLAALNVAGQLQLLSALGLGALSPDQLAPLGAPPLGTPSPSLLQQLAALTKATQPGLINPPDLPGIPRSPPGSRPYSDLLPSKYPYGGGNAHSTPSGSRISLPREREREFDFRRLEQVHESHPLHDPIPPYQHPPPSHYHSVTGMYGQGYEALPLQGRRLFVKNLHYSTNWQRIKDTFRRAGNVSHVDVLKNPDGRSRGFAVIVYDLPDDAQRAIEMFNNCELDGRRIEVRYDRVQS